MADNAVVHIGENSPENIAFKMMNLIAAVENREPYGHGDSPMTREWILKTYAQCRKAVSGNVSDFDALTNFYNPGASQRRR